MEDVHGTKIQIGDCIVGTTNSGEVVEGIVTHDDQTLVRVEDLDTGKESWLKGYRLEVQPVTESRNYCDAWCECPELIRRQSPVWNHHSQRYDVICDGCHKFLTVG